MSYPWFYLASPSSSDSTPSVETDDDNMRRQYYQYGSQHIQRPHAAPIPHSHANLGFSPWYPMGHNSWTPPWAHYPNRITPAGWSQPGTYHQQWSPGHMYNFDFINWADQGQHSGYNHPDNRRIANSTGQGSVYYKKSVEHETKVDIELDKERNQSSFFAHPAIDFNQRQIRLIKVLPTRPGKLIRCKFALATVEDSVRYTALSYTWGKASKETEIVKIILHKQAFWVRRNLWSFLHQVRDDPELREQWFWIDALCIDQAENGENGHIEKNHQVNMMGQIYSNAHKVIAWLGEPAQESHASLHALSQWKGTSTAEEEEDLVRRGLDCLGEGGYWLRIWIVQELVLAKNVCLKIGGFSFDWSDIYRWRSNLRPSGIRNCRYSRAMGWAMVNIIDVRQAWHDGKPLKLWEVWQDFQAFRCADPRDRIYGLLGLMANKPCRADYSLSRVELYAELLLWLVEVGLANSPLGACLESTLYHSWTNSMQINNINTRGGPVITQKLLLQPLAVALRLGNSEFHEARATALKRLRHDLPNMSSRRSQELGKECLNGLTTMVYNHQTYVGPTLGRNFFSTKGW